MKYLLMMNAPRGDGDWQVSDWPPGDFQAHIRFMKELNDRLRASGELVEAQGLAPPGQARIVRAGDQGEPVVTDGPFAESKEFLAGYWMVQVETAERAHEIAAEASTAPGPGGQPLNLAIEVRQVMDGPPDESQPD